MALNLCGKSCEECTYREHLNCPGCAAVRGECEIAVCCRDKGHEACGTCSYQETCIKLRNKGLQPERRERRRELEQKKQEAQAAKDAALYRRAPIFGKWIWYLFILTLANNVVSILLGDGMARLEEILSLAFLFVYAAILLKMAVEERRYRVAALCTIVSGAISTVGTLAIGEDTGWFLLFAIPAAVIGLYGEYQEYYAHADAVEDFDQALAEKWRKLWMWMALAMGGTILGILTLVIVIGVFIAIAASVAMVAVAVMKIIYLYRTAKLFREYVAV